MVWLTNEKRLALFPARAIARYPHHRKSPIRHQLDYILIFLFHHACFFFFLIIDLYFLVPAAIAQTYSPFATVAIPTGIPRKKAKPEIKIHPLNVEAKVRKCSI